MKLKKYLEFINESITDTKFWELSEEEIREFFIEMIDEFDDIVSKEFEFTKIEKEETKWLITKYPSGNKEKKEYKKMITYYVIEYNNDFLSIDSSEDEEDYHNLSLYDIFINWCCEKNFVYNLNPAYSDYGYVSAEEINKEIETLCEQQ